jgi:tetratricopeptide (TPR) repeat protein
MSMTLNLVDSLLHQSQKLHSLGRTGDAHRLLLRLAGLRKLPPETAETSQALLAEIYLKRRQFRRARRSLTAALAHQENSAKYHYLIAQTWQDDDKGDNQLAREHYLRSLELDPDQPDCKSRLGYLQVELGEVEEGLERLRQAVEMAPHDPALLRRHVEGLRLADQSDEARSAILAARFRNPRDTRFQKVWNDFQFEELRHKQDQGLRTDAGNSENEPVLLPFISIPDEAQRSRPFRKIG